MFKAKYIYQHAPGGVYIRRDGRVVEGATLEMWCGETHRGFESLSLRHLLLFPVKRSKTRKAEWRGRVSPCRFFVWEYRMTSARWGGEQAPLPVKRSKTRKAKWRGRVSSCRFFVREFRMTSARWGENKLHSLEKEVKQEKRNGAAGFPPAAFLYGNSGCLQSREYPERS